MNVGELIDTLLHFNPKTPVVLASDPEGNEYHWLDTYGNGFIKSGTVHLETIYGSSDELESEREAAEEWGDEAPKFDPVVVLWP